MRMGRPLRPRRSAPRGQATNPSPPLYSSRTLEVGRVSPDVVSSVLAPLLREMAEASVEAHADAALMAASREEGIGGHEGGEREAGEAEVGPDGQPRIVVESADSNGTPPLPRGLFTGQEDVDEFETLLTETAARFRSPSNRWKVQANAAKFERLLDERYGRLRP